MTRRRDEHGAVAIMVAGLSLALFGVTAMAVDLGNAYMQRRDIQSVTDFAALAGGAGKDLPGTTNGTCAYGTRANATDQAIKDVASYFGTAPWTNGVSASSLVDCNIANGEAFYGTVVYSSANSSGVVLTYDQYKLSVISPPRHVSFGLAGVLGFKSVDVGGKSTVAIKSPNLDTLPYYAVQGCDFGNQTLQQPNNGHAAKDLLSHTTETNAATVTGASPPTMNVDDTTQNITITGTGLAGVTDVGFFEQGASGPGPEPVTVSSSNFASQTSTQIVINAAKVPTAVTSTPNYWFVRVKIGDNWSATTYEGKNKNDLVPTPSIVVGQPTLNCGQGSTSGNFGTLDIPNSHVSGEPDQIAYNIAAGLDISLSIYDPATQPWECGSTLPSIRPPSDGANCIGTKTGSMDAGPALEGLVTGVPKTTVKGLLTNVGPDTGCAADGAPATTVFATTGITINNDNLTCFFTDDTTSIGDVSNSAYTGPEVISAKIFKSPRFVTVPIFGEIPNGSKYEKILGWRSAFIAEQPNSATRTNPQTTASNGLVPDGNGGLQSVQLIFINDNALPPRPDDGHVTDYKGTGPRVLRLVS